MNSNIFIISAPSGTGKNTIIKRLLEIESLNLKHSISTTSRLPRSYESEGEHYYFVDKKKFDEMILGNYFLEFAKVMHNYYGTTYKEIERIQKENKIPILDLDVQGARLVRKRHPEAVQIFIMPPSLDALRERLEQRSSESEEEIDRRIELARKEIRSKGHYDKVFVNDDLERVLSKIESFIKSKKSTVWMKRG